MHRLVIALLLLLAGCGSDETPEDRVRALIGDMEQAVEEGSIRSASALLHDAYSDKWHPDRRAATRSLFGYLRRHDNIHLLTVTRDVDVAPDGQSASAVVYVAMSGTPVQSVDALLSVKADLYRFDVGLAQFEGAWRVRESNWERITIDGFAR